jgi:predicted membrane channel-forming protein YqfA (hemolysin III family)
MGWMGVLWLLLNTVPTVAPRWMFFFCLFLALTGSALPFIAFLNRRFQGSVPAPQHVIVRQSIWIGVYGVLMAWLQIGRVVTLALALFLGFGMLMVEGFIRLRERSQWRD